MRPTRVLVSAAAAVAATIAMAAPALADGPVVQVTSLPANVDIPAGGSVSVNVPNAAVCAPGTSNLTVVVRGRQDAVTPVNVPGAGCSAGQLNYSILDNPNSLRRHATVQFIAQGSGGGRTVQTLVVHITGDQRGQGQDNRRCHDHGRNSCLLQ